MKWTTSHQAVWDMIAKGMLHFNYENILTDAERQQIMDILQEAIERYHKEKRK